MLHQRKRPAVRCLLATFLSIFVIFLVLPGGGLYEPFWWASMSLIPAVVCAGGLFDEVIGFGKRAVLAGCATVILLVGLGIATANTLSNAGHYEPRASVRDFAEDFLVRGRAAFDRGDLQEAESRFIYVLNIGGPRADAYCGLARVALERHQPFKAARLIKRCLALDPKHPGALELQRKMIAVK